MDRCPFCRTELEQYELEPDDRETMRPDGAGVCGECYARWHDAPVYASRLASVEREQESWRLSYIRQAEQHEDATARAKQAERQRDEARATLDRVEEWLAAWETETGCPVDTGLEDGCPTCRRITGLRETLRGGEAPRA